MLRRDITSKCMNVLWRSVKSSAKRRGIDFSLTVPELNDMTFPITCPILGLPLEYNTGLAGDNSPSLDRIDSSRGYEIDNILVISNRANRLKSDATPEELRLISSFYSDLDKNMTPDITH